MKCKDIINLLSPYLEGELGKESREELEIHLKECPSCREELVLLEAAIQGVRDLEEVMPPANLLTRINEELDKRLLSPRLSLIWEKMTRPLEVPVLAKSLALAATILLILYLVVGPGQVYFTPKGHLEVTRGPSEFQKDMSPSPVKRIGAPIVSCPFKSGGPAKLCMSKSGYIPAYVPSPFKKSSDFKQSKEADGAPSINSPFKSNGPAGVPAPSSLLNFPSLKA